MIRTDAQLLPAGACDTHMHFYDHRFPGAASAVKPTPPDFSTEDYRATMRRLGHSRMVVVQPTTYGLDNRLQLAAAAEFGQDARVVVVVDETVTDAELARLDAQGACAVRFFMWKGGALGWDSLQPVAERIAPLGWHIELHIDGATLPEHLERLVGLPCPAVLDHVGRFREPAPEGHPAARALEALMDTGRWWVKLSAPGLQCSEGLRARVERLIERTPDRLVWATNCPHPGQLQPPNELEELRTWLDWIDDPALVHKIFCSNPEQLYRFRQFEDAT
jgi:D-galactarolactone isomerase